MIFQINYKTNKYDEYINKNKHLTDQLDYKLFNTDSIETFLDEYGYRDEFDSLVVVDSERHQEMAIKCDYLRLMILYELGGVYIDIDSILYDDILTLEDDLLEKFGYNNIVSNTRSLFFIKGLKGSSYIKSLLDVYRNRVSSTYDIDNIPRNIFFNLKSNVRIINNLDKYFYHIPHGEDK